MLAGGVWALLSPGQGGPVTGTGDVGLIDPVLVIPTIVALALLGLRDKTIFLAARGEHYWLKLFVFFFPFTDQIAAFKTHHAVPVVGGGDLQAQPPFPLRRVR